ncbi:MAG: TetR/AcrR family transcriptional regulator [Dactylosporangium sp.]|nr:TetR/AcrR family transcriptional regulator [Dactylosporangium sp.]NNJ60954.1 TetR/AcrR family transcriptional regulator [Dactylosporangium sp.]
MPATPNRRERLRAATIGEIHAVARRLLVQEGAGAVTLRAISRDMGMTAPALYRYYPSLDDLLHGLYATFYDESRQHVETTIEAAPGGPGARMFIACRALRAWSIDHPAEFTAMFASRASVKPGGAAPEPGLHAAGMRFADTFLRLFVDLWQHDGIVTPPDADVPPPLAAQLTAFLTQHHVPLPVGAMHAFVSAWVRLFGMIALEVFGYLHFCLTDSQAMFEAELAAIGRQLGLEP